MNIGSMITPSEACIRHLQDTGMMTIPCLARIGDRIETTVRYPTPGVIRMTLETPEACAYANGLLMNQESGWQLVPSLSQQGGPQQ